MEAATTRARARERKSAAADRELAIRLGSLMLHALGSEGGAVVRALDESGLSFTQMKALMALSGGEDAEPCPVKLVAERIGVSLPSASRAVEGLVKRDLATRLEDPEDRRVRRVSLTRAGNELADRIMAARLSGLERFIGTLTASERRKLDGALEALVGRDEIASIYRRHARMVGR
jgi:DNA-binding MarR family transcriptional regulator